MSAQEAALTWSLEVFLDCYNSIKLHGTVPTNYREALKNDLRSILVVPAKNDKSRSALVVGESEKPVTFHNGQEYKLNSLFVSAASNLASNLNLDELSSAELLHEASVTTFAHGSSAVDAGILGFYQRYTYIVNIIGFLVSEKQLHLLYGGDVSGILPQILKSFKQIYSLVSLQNDFIDKENATGDVNNLLFVNKITFAKEHLFELHDLLAQVLYSLFDNYMMELGSYELYHSILTHINECVKDDSDSLILHYIPALMRVMTGLLDMKEDHVQKIHLNFVSTLKSDFSKVNSNDEIDTSKSAMRPYEQFLQLVFYISFVPWCKMSASRTKKFDFQNDILKYIEWLINYGTMEQLLCYSAESTNMSTKVAFDQSKLFDFRPLLQKSFPRLKTVLFKYSRNEELQHVARTRPGYSNLTKLCDTLSLTLSPNMREALLAPLLHSFFYDFVNHSAIILTSLRDNEEDFLLSSINRKLEAGPIALSPNSMPNNDQVFGKSDFGKSSMNSVGDFGIDLDELATRAELERFYLAFAYTYCNRATICQDFWTNDNGNVVGFISWGLANNTSPLITATFCLLLGSLTYCGHNSSDKIWEILCNSGLSKKKDYSQISVDSIVCSLSYYIDALEESVMQDLCDQKRLIQEKHETLFTNGVESVGKDQFPVQLSEDSVVFIAGFMMLISMIVENLSSPVIKQAAFLHFFPIISSFLRLDNLVTSAKNSQSEEELHRPSLNDENRTAIVNLVLNLLTKLANNADIDIKCKIWVLVDKWVSHSSIESEPMGPTTLDSDRQSKLALTTSTCKNETQRLKNINRVTTMRNGFNINLTRLSEVSNFVKLMEKLLEDSRNCNQYATFSLSFPADLGQKNRQKNLVGIWPYIEYLITEVFSKSSGLDEKNLKQDLQKLVLNIIVNALREVDWNILDKTAQDILPDFQKYTSSFASAMLSSGETTTLSLHNYTRLHHSFAVINYLFDENASKVLFEIINVGCEEISPEMGPLSLVSLALEALESMLVLQTSFIDKLSLFKNSDDSHGNKNIANGYGTSMSLMLSSSQVEFNKISYPDTLGTKGVSNYYEMLLYHITSVANIALYVGNSKALIVNVSIRILSLISQSTTFSSCSKNSLLQHNRLLSFLESIDESKKIKFAFIQQLEDSSDLESKLNILNFLIDNLPLTRETTVSHFLLGFDIKAEKLQIQGSSNSYLMLRSLLSMLLETLPLIFNVDYSQGYQNRIDYAPTILSSLIMKILVRLCQNSNSSRITLEYLRQHDLFVKIVSTQPKIDDMTVWQRFRFNGDVQSGSRNVFLRDKECRDTFHEFISFRNSVLKYLSLELHDVGSRSRKDSYIALLLDGSEFLDGTARILNFLDVMHYQLYNTDDLDFTEFENSFNLRPLALEMEERSKASNKHFSLDAMVSLKCKMANNNLSNEDAKSIFETQAKNELAQLEITLNDACFVHQMKIAHSKTLHAWVQIVQVLSSDEVTKKTNFIPQVLQVVLPRINDDFHEQDVLLAEELISLCLFLFDLLEIDSQKEFSEANKTSSHGLFALFKTCVNGLLCSNSSAGLRSDLYLLINKFIQKGFDTKEIREEIAMVLKSVDAKFYDVVCNDSVYSEGVSRITSLILLESLVHFSQKENSNLLITALTKNNTLSLLVRSLKRADDIITACGEMAPGKRDSGMNLETLFYELTALKTTLFIFVRLGQTRPGAFKLIENDIFATLRKLRLLAIDAELGLDFLVQNSEEGVGHDSTIQLALDVPLSIRDKSSHGEGGMKTLSLYEILTPIFQLIATIILSLGPSFELGISQVEGLMKYSHSIVLGVMKRDSLMESKRIGPASGVREEDMDLEMMQLVNLITLIYTVISSTEGGETSGVLHV